MVGMIGMGKTIKRRNLPAFDKVKEKQEKISNEHRVILRKLCGVCNTRLWDTVNIEKYIGGVLHIFRPKRLHYKLRRFRRMLERICSNGLYATYNDHSMEL